MAEPDRPHAVPSLRIKFAFVPGSAIQNTVVTGIGVRLEGDRLAVLQPFGPGGVGMTIPLATISTVTITASDAHDGG